MSPTEETSTISASSMACDQELVRALTIALEGEPQLALEVLNIRRARLVALENDGRQMAESPETHPTGSYVFASCELRDVGTMQNAVDDLIEQIRGSIR